MIEAQTTFLGLPVKAVASTLKDGTMKLNSGVPNDEVIQNRKSFLKKCGTNIEHAVLCNLSYEDAIEYTRICEAGADARGQGMQGTATLEPADAWFTKEKNLALFLPLADCGGVVLFDARQQVLGMLHLGRHGTFDNLAEKAVEFMKREYGTDPKDLRIWISPSISGDSYLLHTFIYTDVPEWQGYFNKADNGWLVDLQGYNISRFVAMGVPPEYIEHSGIDTATHPEFPSHYRHVTHGDTDKAGRVAGVAYMRS